MNKKLIYYNKEIEDFLNKHKIIFREETQVIGKFKPDYLLDNNIMIEIKFVDDINSNKWKDPPHVRNMISQGTLRTQLLNKIYPDKKFKQIVIMKRESGRCSHTNFLYGNILFELFLPFNYLDLVKDYLKKTKSKEDIFFEILDDLFEKQWVKKRSSFPSIIYHYLSCLEKQQQYSATRFCEMKKYPKGTQNTIYYYLKILEKLNIIKKEKGLFIINNIKWRYFPYLFILSIGTTKNINLNYAEDLWNRIIKIFESK